MSDYPTKPHPAPAELEKLKPISRLHLLIHPGYNLDVRQHSLKAEKRKAAEELIGRYVKTALEIKNSTEFLIIFCHNSSEKYQRDLKKKKTYAVAINLITGLLSKRAIVIFGNEMAFAPLNEEEAEQEEINILKDNFSKLKQVVNDKNRSFDEQVDVVAYGEDHQECVTENARGLHQAGGFKKPIAIISELTDRPEQADHAEPGENRIVYRQKLGIKPKKESLL